MTIRSTFDPAPEASAEPPLPAPAVAAAIRILDFLARQNPRAGLTELSRSLGINKSTCYNILLTLCHFGAVTRTPEAPKYQLGPKIAELGGAVRRHFWHRDLLRRHFEGLIADTRLPCVIGQLLGDEMSFVIIDKIVPAGLRGQVPAQPVGTVYPLSGAAMGCALLSRFDEDEALEIVKQVNPALRAVEEKVWRSELRDIRRRGYAISLERYQNGVNAVAAPIEKSGEAYLP